MKNINILFVDDEPNELELFELNMGEFSINTCIDSNKAYNEFILKKCFDFIFLDIYMPKIDGMELCRNIRKSHINKNSFIYAYTIEPNKKIQEIIFRNGFDDIIEKPMYYDLLKEKLNAVIKRNLKPKYQENTDILLEKDFSYYLNGKEVKLTNKEYEILRVLSSNKQKVFDSYDIFEAINIEYDTSISNDGIATVRNHIKNIRKKFSKIEPDKEYIKTIPQKGYILDCLDIIMN